MTGGSNGIAMDPQSSRPAQAGRNTRQPAVPKPTVILADPAWRRRMPGVVKIAARAAAIVGATEPTIVLSSDSAVRRLNARYRGRSRATNVLSFSGSGEIVLALGVVCREARKARLRPAGHLAHLVLHGMLHLAGHDHHAPGDARRMALAETRLLRRLGLSDPWRRG